MVMQQWPADNLRVSHTAKDGSRPIALLVANTDWYLYNFRQRLIRDAHTAGWQIVLACTEGEHAQALHAAGWEVERVDFPGGELALGKETRALLQLAAIIRRHRPAVIHLLTLKCVLYGMLGGVVAAPGARYIGALTGLGYLFTAPGIKSRAIKNGVLVALRGAATRLDAHMIFQNTLDYSEFSAARVLPAERMHVIRGSGVDVAAFSPPTSRRRYEKPLHVLYCGRLIAEKGIHDYLAAVALARRDGANITSRIAGAPFPGNPSSISEARMAKLRDDPVHEYLGHCRDMAALFAEADIVVLPTYYREGTPKSLLEAAASGCIIITTTIPACDDIVDHGENGYRVPPKSPAAIAACLIRLSAESPVALHRMAMRSTDIARERFKVETVNRRTLMIYGNPSS